MKKCLICEKVIPAERLQFRPQTITCSAECSEARKKQVHRRNAREYERRKRKFRNEEHNAKRRVYLAEWRKRKKEASKNEVSE